MTDSKIDQQYTTIVAELLEACRAVEQQGSSIGRLRKLMTLLVRGHFGNTINYANSFPALACLRYDMDPTVSTLGVDLDHTPGATAERTEAGIFIGVRRVTSHKVVLNDLSEIEPEATGSSEPEQGITVFTRRQRVELIFTSLHPSHDVAWDLTESLMEFLLGVKESVQAIAGLDEFEINEALPRRRNPQTAAAQHAVALHVGVSYGVQISTQTRTHALRSVMVRLQAETSDE